MNPQIIPAASASAYLFRFILNEYLGCKKQEFYWSVELLATDLQNFLHESGGMAGVW